MTIDSYSSVSLLGSAREIATSFKMSVAQKLVNIPKLDQISFKVLSTS